MLGRIQFFLRHSFRKYSSYNKYIDYSKVPLLKESDLHEQFVKGSGPGGSKINTTSSCVVLKHISTGTTRRFSNISKQIDFSKVPVLNEKDLIEQQVRGSGPGGQKINKTASCVVLKHIPTGLVVKCQETRYLEQNRKIARSILITKIDNLLNGDDSIEAQKKRYSSRKRSIYESKKEKLKQLKEAWKERENLK